jgi:hypothetical protein
LKPINKVNFCSNDNDDEYALVEKSFLARKDRLLPTSLDNLDIIKTVLGGGHKYRLQALGFSMSPFIKSGDILTIAPLGSNVLRLGDVAAFVHPERKRLIVHRVIGKSIRGFVLMKGDNLDKADGHIPWDYILGYVIRIERGKKVINFGMGPERFLIAILNRSEPLLSFILNFARFARHHLKRGLSNG